MDIGCFYFTFPGMSSFWLWWQHLPESISPVIFQLGNFRLQYYGLMYILAFILTYLLATHRSNSEDEYYFTTDFHKDILTSAFIGVLVGGRLGYVFFYNFAYYAQHPLEIIWPFELESCQFTGISGMSYHGGLIGVFVAVAWFCRKKGESFWHLADLYGPIIPLGYTFGRLGNFINGELYGRVTQASIGMYFPKAPTKALRHPSQLYEAAFEGLFCFVLLWFLRKLKLPRGSMVGLYLISYGTVRFIIEYFREPDTHLGFIFLKFSMGQLLCIAMILAGGVTLIYRWRVAKAPPSGS